MPKTSEVLARVEELVLPMDLPQPPDARLLYERSDLTTPKALRTPAL